MNPNNTKLKLLIVLLCTCSVAYSQPLNTTRDAQLQWFDEGRFCMFIHWGVYAVPAGEWQGNPHGGIGEWILRHAQMSVDMTAERVKPFADFMAQHPAIINNNRLGAGFSGAMT